MRGLTDDERYLLSKDFAPGVFMPHLRQEAITLEERGLLKILKVDPDGTIYWERTPLSILVVYYDALARGTIEV
jgi:hypothetical protein